MRALLLSWLLVCGVAQATPQLADFTLPALAGGDDLPLASLQGQPYLISFFEPECGWCRKQLKDLSQLAPARQMTVVAAGIGSNAPGLRQLVSGIDHIHKVQAPAALLRALGGIKATPLTLLVNDQGEISFVARGYLGAEGTAALLDRQAQR